MYTTIPVRYRDYANYQWHSDIRLQGAITADQITALRAALLDGALYCPLQVGLTHLGAAESSLFPGVNDHGWHEMDLGTITVDDARYRLWDASPVPTMEARWPNSSPECTALLLPAGSPCYLEWCRGSSVDGHNQAQTPPTSVAAAGARSWLEASRGE